MSFDEEKPRPHDLTAAAATAAIAAAARFFLSDVPGKRYHAVVNAVSICLDPFVTEGPNSIVRGAYIQIVRRASGRVGGWVGREG